MTSLDRSPTTTKKLLFFSCTPLRINAGMRWSLQVDYQHRWRIDKCVVYLHCLADHLVSLPDDYIGSWLCSEQDEAAMFYNNSAIAKSKNHYRETIFQAVSVVCGRSTPALPGTTRMNLRCNGKFRWCTQTCAMKVADHLVNWSTGSPFGWFWALEVTVDVE